MDDFVGTQYHYSREWFERHRANQERKRLGKPVNRFLYCYDGPFKNDPHAVVISLSIADHTRWTNHKTRTERDVQWNEFGPFIKVTDSKTKEKWMVASAPCGARCHCAAVAVRPV